MARRFLFHLDLDEFIAAVERLRHPELEGKPIVVGGDGDPTKRGVVSTASYEASAFGIRSAMPLRTAYKRNPDAIFLAVDADAYLETSNHVMDTLRRSTPRSRSPVGTRRSWRLRRTIPRPWRARSNSGSCDARAVVHDRDRGQPLQAKLASGFGKPRGVFVLTSDQWNETMFGLTTSELWGIGSKTAAKLADRDPHRRAAGATMRCWRSASDRGPDPGSRASDAARDRPGSTRRAGRARAQQGAHVPA